MQGLIFWILFIIAGLLHVFGTYFPVTFSKLTMTQTMMLSGFIAIIQYGLFKTPAIYRIKGTVNPSEVEAQWIVMTFVFACLYQEAMKTQRDLIGQQLAAQQAQIEALVRITKGRRASFLAGADQTR